ncbi:MAG: chemotaxis protein CheB [Acidobacteria bacterium]|nr:chemotaxis protein CheB [Acidobacteriota bacterium]
MRKKDIVVIGASAGGFDALRLLVGALPKNFSASLFIVLHIAPQSPGVLADILSRAGHLPALHPKDGEAIRSGHIYVAPPDHHLLLEANDTMRVTRGPKENRFRPAVDPLFRSAARAYGGRVIGVILTGGLDDGTAGIWAVKRRGGTAIVQDPLEAVAPSMPLNVLRHITVDYCVPLVEIAPLLARLTPEAATDEGGFAMPEELDIEVEIAAEKSAMRAGVMTLGEPSIYTCPECHGTLLQMKDSNLLRFRCHTGHAFSVNSLLAELNDNIENTMWNAVRALEESAILMRHLAEHLSQSAEGEEAEALLQKASAAQQRAEVIKQVLMNHDRLSKE